MYDTCNVKEVIDTHAKNSFNYKKLNNKITAKTPIIFRNVSETKDVQKILNNLSPDQQLFFENKL